MKKEKSIDEKNNNINKLFNYFKYIVLFLLFFKATSELICSAEQLYDVTKSIGFWKGLIFLGAAIAIAYGIDYKNVFVYVCTAVYYIVAILFLRKMNLRVDSPELWEWVLYRTLAFGTLIPSVVSGFSKRKFRIPDKRIIISAALLIIPAIFVYIIDMDRMNMPFVILFLMIYAFIWTEQKNKEELVLCLLAAIYVCIIYTFVKSLIQVPYTFEKHYVGNFSNSTTFSPFIGIGSVSCLALFGYITKQFSNIKLYQVILLAISILPLLLALIIINNRNAFFAIALIILLFAYLILMTRKNTKGIIALVAVPVVLLALLLMVCFAVYRKYGMIEPGNPVVFRLWKTAMCLNRTESKLGVIPDGSILNPIDWLLSSRLSIWLVTVKQLHIWKGNPTIIQVTDGYKTGAHNTVLGLLNMYGVAWGLMIVVSYCIPFVYCFLKVRETYKRDEKTPNIFIYLSALFFMLYCVGIFINEMFYIPTFYNVIYIMFIVLICSDSISAKKNQNEYE